MCRKLRIFFEHVVVSLVNNSETRTLLYSAFLKKSAHTKEKSRYLSLTSFIHSNTNTNLQDTLESGIRRGAGKEEKGKVENKSFSQKESHLNLQFDIFHNEL